MSTLTAQPVSRSSRALLSPLFELAKYCPALKGGVAGNFSVNGEAHDITRFHFRGPKAEHDPLRIGLFAALHGDEPAGAEALVRWLAELAGEPWRATGYDLTVFPICNPTGYEANTRHNHAGLDLNREFWRKSAQPEVGILERELTAGKFDGIITLHSDDTSEGLYGYAHGRLLNEALLKPALRASERVLPRNRASVIDGFEASEGLIHRCFEGVLSAPVQQRPQPFDLIFETPALAPIDLQIEATVIALETVLEEYRVFLAHSINL
ncbi:M14 family metallopeptidase [Rariglobus hedericola]|uniref:M14 family metallocarboxypeptidase n=1 Tax=Rariglobus hedericola TaxID=2597822 RepID=A0A556QDH0_9BACT|nr:M14 family metallocarboxypeptidase [Rariglobus hedericola]TSJ74709.1 M14 family metallocarboxypeptidase [Rariglobus hedericola]